MKSIIYFLLGAMLLSTLISSFPSMTNQAKNKITLHCSDTGITEKAFNRSVEIISERIRSVGIDSFKIKPHFKKGKILISFPPNYNASILRDLVGSKGHLEFYETYERNDIMDRLDKDDMIFNLIQITDNELLANDQGYSAILGSCQTNDTSLANTYINDPDFKYQISNNLLFAWSKFPGTTGELSLYLLKQGKADLNSTSIQSAKASLQQESEQVELMITFDQNGSDLWTKLTNRNINKVIAMVLDHEVYYAPVVKQTIKNGKLSMTGDLDPFEILKLAAIINHGELPIDFEIAR